ncbi:hypothetical protein SAMN04487846_3042 [Microbacterium sp. cf046]|uniref:hypothetical protein n=1 Tax=Microbacterium sp. cf046 TaxID=1761803 RepID=UPI0008F3B505|nr:hypothetical protein [Microbacterium sp. cf046]SFS15111.1 hypothetical protein SAMN04487846_3042 [Microbacterium sp. cf046]
MLSTITAAETQFRHEYETRQREINLLASIRERRAAETDPVGFSPNREATARPARSARARPIGITPVAASTAACAA